MRLRNTAAAVFRSFLFAAALPACTTSGLVADGGSALPPQRVTGEYILRVSDEQCLAAAIERLAGYGARAGEALGEDAYLIRLQSDPGPEKLTAILRPMSCIRSVQPNFLYQAF